LPRRRWDLRIKDMIASIEHIMAYTSGLDFKQFQLDRKTVDAVVRNFEIIGEAAAHVPAEIVADYSKIPWQDIRDMRNLMIHEYFGINEKIVWHTIQEDLSPLIVQLNEILKNQNSSQS